MHSRRENRPPERGLSSVSGHLRPDRHFGTDLAEWRLSGVISEDQQKPKGITHDRNGNAP